jgi:hypothetical protein
VQADDSYPTAPPPEVGQAALAGTTTHGTLFYLDPSIRYRLPNNMVIGIAVRVPMSVPENGLVPQSRISLIIFPMF